MLLYLVLFILVGGLAFVDIATDKPRLLTNIQATIIASVFWVLSFSRWQNGTDWEPYLYVYKTLSLHGTVKDALTGYMAMEPGYLLVNLALGWARSYHFFLFVIGFVVIGLKMIRIVDLSPCATYSCLIYLASLLGDIFFVRQSVAISICFFSLKYLLAREHKKFVLCIFIAATFHFSALVFLAALPLAKHTVRSRAATATLFFSAAVLSFLFFDRIVGALGNILVPIQYISDRLTYLTDNATVGALSSPARNGLRVLEKVSVYFFFASRLSHVDIAFRKTYAVLLNLYFISVLITCLFSFGAIAILRTALYFSTSELILFPLAILSFNGVGRQIMALIGVGYALLRFWTLMQPYYDLYVPYRFYGMKL